jgi:hypothetical protein
VTATAALVIGLVWGVRAVAPAPLTQQPVADLPVVAAPGLDLAGIAATVTDGERLQLAPTWFVRANQPDLLAHWKLVAADGRVVSEIEGAPRFGAWRSAAWAPGEVVQDAAELALPPGLPAGVYTATLSLRTAESGEDVLIDQPLLTMVLPAIPPLRRRTPRTLCSARRKRQWRRSPGCASPSKVRRSRDVFLPRRATAWLSICCGSR